MKKVLMAALVVMTFSAGSAHAVIEGGCIPPKGPKKPTRPDLQARPRNNCPNGGCVAAVRG